MTKKPTIPPDVKFHPVSYDDILEHFNYDRAKTCCGVTEVGEFSCRRNPFKTLTVKSIETKTKEYTYTEYWPTVKIVTQMREVPKHTRTATYEEILTALKDIQDNECSKKSGMGIAWLRPEQMRSEYRRLFLDLGWTEHPSFYNPNTRRTLVMFTKVFRKTAPRRKKSVKSILAA